MRWRVRTLLAVRGGPARSTPKGRLTSELSSGRSGVVMSGTGRRARWGKGCAMCSVMVADERGLLAGSPGEWIVLCGRCEDMARRSGRSFHTDQPPPTVRIERPPRNTAARTWVRAYGIHAPCRSCAVDVMSVAGVFPVEPGDTFRQLVLVTTDSAWRLVEQLLDRSHVAGELAAAIRARPGSSGGGDHLTGVCAQCGAPYTVADDSAVRAAIVERGLHGLRSIVAADCSVVRWHRALYDPERVLIRV